MVTSSADTTKHGTLRSAILYANAHAGTTITFASNLAPHIIRLSSDLPLLDCNVTIDGGADHITVSDGFRLRVGRYRVLFDEDAATILAIYIGRRATTTYRRS
jgi:mRNA interferase RelE/StbE